MAWLIKPDGSETEVHAAKGPGKRFTLQELQAAVDGYIEGVYVTWEGKRRRAYVNEEGLINGLPVNRTATAILRPEYMGNVITGNMIVMLPGEGG